MQSKLQLGEYEKDGGKRVSLGVIADHVLALRQPRREKPNMAATETAKAAENPPSCRNATNPEFDDAIPYESVVAAILALEYFGAGLLRSWRLTRLNPLSW
jgi:hypothetical protein